LKNLSKEYLNLKVDKTFQKANWRVRPLAKGMIDYGVGDAFLLVGVFYA
jgi:ribonuclease D